MYVLRFDPRMENLDLSLLEIARDASTGVSDFSISLDGESSDNVPSKSEQGSADGLNLTTDYSKVSTTLVEVKFKQ